MPGSQLCCTGLLAEQAAERVLARLWPWTPLLSGLTPTGDPAILDNQPLHSTLILSQSLYMY